MLRSTSTYKPADYSQLLKTTIINLKFDMINQCLKNVRRASLRV